MDDNDTKEAEKLLQNMYPNMITIQQLEDYNEHRFDNDLLPRAFTEALQWKDHDTHIERIFYIEIENEWVPKRALYGIWVGMGNKPCLIIEDIYIK